MNLLSVGAAYGLMVLVFQKGYGADLLGVQQMPAIESWIPLFLFCVLFGLSMDYHVFLLSRVQEQYRATGDNLGSVVSGLQATGRIITGAALMMVIVFSGFAMGELVMFQQMAFGLAVAILLDATIVRSVLVPASMALLGNLNWYLPGWLAWLPDLRIEGHAMPSPAALLVYDQKTFSRVDLRVDIHDEPVGELRRVFEAYRPAIPYYAIRQVDPTVGSLDEWLARNEG